MIVPISASYKKGMGLFFVLSHNFNGFFTKSGIVWVHVCIHSTFICMKGALCLFTLRLKHCRSLIKKNDFMFVGNHIKVICGLFN